MEQQPAGEATAPAQQHQVQGQSHRRLLWLRSALHRQLTFASPAQTAVLAEVAVKVDLALTATCHPTAEVLVLAPEPPPTPLCLGQRRPRAKSADLGSSGAPYKRSKA